MPYETFTWPVSNNTRVGTTHKPLEAKFEGYRQIAGDGLKVPARTVRVDVGPMEIDEAQACWDFLDNQRGLPFLWTPIAPLAQVESLWTCNAHEFAPLGGLLRGVQATFENFNTPAG